MSGYRNEQAEAWIAVFEKACDLFPGFHVGKSGLEAVLDLLEQLAERSKPATCTVDKYLKEQQSTSLPESAEDRNGMPIADGVLYYFPNALAEISRISKFGNDQHNPGQDMHWSRGKSTDHANKIIRHLIDAGKTDAHGNRHSAFVAWRALALLQEELERDLNLPLPKNARYDSGS